MVNRVVTTSRWFVVIAAALGIVVTAGGTFLPWLRSGAVNRDSYEVVALALRLGIADGALARGALACWSAVPIICAVGCVLFALRFDRAAAVSVICSACLIGTVAVVFTVQGGAIDTHVAVARAGPVMSMVGALIALLAACGVFITKRRAGSNADSVRSTT